MPTLILDNHGQRSGGLLSHRLIIGRKAVCELVIDDPAVSRVHGWIEPRDGGWYVGDGGGTNGVLLNGDRIERGAMLHDGDQIQIGPAMLEFSSANQLPRGIKLLSFEPASSDKRDATGQLIDCPCGAPMWLTPVQMQRGRSCPQCGQLVRPPKPPAATCSICQSPISANEQSIPCPDCGLLFHKDCWRENLGCSAYGCPQVNVLAAASGASDQASSSFIPVHVEAGNRGDGTPWEYLLLAGSVIGTVLGIFTYGLPAGVVAVAALIALFRSASKRGVVLAAMLLSVLGGAGGAYTSMLLWMH